MSVEPSMSWRGAVVEVPGGQAPLDELLAVEVDLRGRGVACPRRSYFSVEVRLADDAGLVLTLDAEVGHGEVGEAEQSKFPIMDVKLTLVCPPPTRNYVAPWLQPWCRFCGAH